VKKRNFDLFLLIPLVAIVSLGLISLSSALAYNQSKFYVQAVWVFLAVIVFVVVSNQKRRVWEHLAVPLFFANIILLFLTLIIGKEINGSVRWLDIGFMNFQPSELTKLSIILFLAYRFNQKPLLKDGYRFRDIIPELFALSISFILILKEPDLGTTLLIGMMSAIVIVSNKINIKSLIIFTFVIVTGSVLAWKFNFVKQYQKTRVEAVIAMIVSPDKEGLSRSSQYHTKQSIIAIGSGGLTGKGFKKGTQNILRFVPEHHTDFIFSVLAEEFGFLGVLLLLFLYLLLFLRCIVIINRVREKFSALVIIGTVSLLWLQVVINVGMVAGMLPVVGIPLPFFSYGGSALIMNTLLVALVHNVSVDSSYR